MEFIDIDGAVLASLNCDHAFSGEEIFVERKIPSGNEIIGLSFVNDRTDRHLYNLAFVLWRDAPEDISMEEKMIQDKDEKEFIQDSSKTACFMWLGGIAYPFLGTINALILMVKSNVLNPDEELYKEMLAWGTALLICSLLTGIPLL